jgi:hypothetical protein
LLSWACEVFVGVLVSGSLVVAVESLDVEVDEGASVLGVDEGAWVLGVDEGVWVLEVVLLADVTLRSIVVTIEPAETVTIWSGSVQSHPEYPKQQYAFGPASGQLWTPLPGTISPLTSFIDHNIHEGLQ